MYLSACICLLLALVLEFGWRSARSMSIWIATVYSGPCQARQELASVVSELQTVSVQDDFVKHSKLKRRMAKLEEESSQYGKLVLKRSLWLIVPIYSVLVMMSLGYAVVVRTAAAFHLPESWVYPFGSLLAFPTSHEVGTVSMWWWLAASRQVLYTARKLVSASR
ncbi:guided entry of tail-anchored proteins factor 1-like [Sycon ciliatum]|uniref:guided entry of tail-anchored proteins factor 1-like n=1 Tax=Sycon ciliatum TaxID=27933 RepID=UPI0031F6F300